jgi:hypothetical protein
MSMRRLEEKGQLRWTRGAVAVGAGALALMAVWGATTASSQAKNLPCSNSAKTHQYVIMCDEDGTPTWVSPKQDFHVKRSDSVLFVNPSEMWVTVKVKDEPTKVFEDGNEVVLAPHGTVCMKIAKGAPIKTGIVLDVGYIVPTATAAETMTGTMATETAQAAGGRPKPTPTPTATPSPSTPPAGTVKPLAGPRMDIDN